jgi:membrane-bound metal-dependent hydrolase YbcI (DUF457 family)
MDHSKYIYIDTPFRFVYMPFTPFHFGVAFPFILWDWKKKRIDALTALVATVIIDARATFLFLFLGERNMAVLHGPLHTFLAATILGVLVGVFFHYTESFWNKILKIFKWEQKTSLYSKICIGVIFAYSHILLDAALYSEMNPFSPFKMGNGLLNWISPVDVIDLCIYGYLIGFVMYLSYLLWYYIKWLPKERDSKQNEIKTPNEEYFSKDVLTKSSKLNDEANIGE